MTSWVLRRVVVVMAQAAVVFILVVGFFGGLWRGA